MAATGRSGSKQKRWSADDAGRVLEAWQQSGLPMAEFCRRRGLSTKRLYWWRRRLAEWTIDEEQREGSGLVQAVVVPPALSAGAAVTLHLRGGDRIEVMDPAHMASDWLVPLVTDLCGGRP